MIKDEQRQRTGNSNRNARQSETLGHACVRATALRFSFPTHESLARELDEPSRQTEITDHPNLLINNLYRDSKILEFNIFHFFVYICLGV